MKKWQLGKRKQKKFVCVKRRKENRGICLRKVCEKQKDNENKQTQHQLVKEQKVLKQHNEKEKEQNIHCNEFEGELQRDRNNQHIPCLSEANKHSKRLM